MFEVKFEMKIAAFTKESQLMTKSEYEKSLLNAEDEISKGNFMIQEDLEKESENW